MENTDRIFFDLVLSVTVEPCNKSTIPIRLQHCTRLIIYERDVGRYVIDLYVFYARHAAIHAFRDCPYWVFPAVDSDAKTNSVA